MSVHARSLRSTLTATALLLTGCAALIAGALVTFAALLHGATEDVASSVAAVALGDEMRKALLRGEPDLPRLDALLAEAHRISSAPSEDALLDDVRDAVDDRRIAEAHAGVDALVAFNIAEAGAAKERARDLRGAASAVGLAALGAVIAWLVAVLLWLRSALARRVAALAEAMRRYADGDVTARAPERGPGELVDIARCFNAVAGALDAQREARAAFLGAVAHDMRNPISALLLTVTALRTRADVRQTEQLGRVQRGLENLNRMTSDFVDRSLVERGDLRLTFDSHDVCALIGECVALFQGSSSTHAIRLRVPDAPVLVQCDAVRIGQVFANLLSNAIKYSPAGGEIVASVEREGAHARVDVTDCGLGIPREDLASIFQPFARSGWSKEIVPGVGLGLFTVRRIVEAHGGRIDVMSAPGNGSTFRVLLPHG